MLDWRPMPDRLFKYQPFTVRSLRNLKDRTLWFSAPKKFNDPFDCALSVFDEPNDEDLNRLLGHAATKTGMNEQRQERVFQNDTAMEMARRRVRETIQRTQQDVLNTPRGVASFGETATNLLMWGHYADGHRGFCLEFDGTVEPFVRAKKVRYQSEFPRVNPVEVLLPTASTPNIQEAFLMTKAECRRYEDEWRLLHKQADHAYTYPWSALKAVHFGAAMPFVDLEIIALILLGSPTKLFRIARSGTSFAIQSEPADYTPYKFDEGK